MQINFLSKKNIDKENRIKLKRNELASTANSFVPSFSAK